MTPGFDASQALAWLETLYGDTQGYINIVSTLSWAGKCFSSPEDCLPYIAHLDGAGAKGIYARVTTLVGIPLPDENGHARRGSVENSKEFIGFWADMDLAGPGHKTSKPLPATEADIMAILAETGLPEPTEMIHSGGGMYPWWLLNEPLAIDNSRQEWVADLASDWQKLIELASEKLGFSYGAGVGDLTRVLRIPGTINRKVEGDPKLCTWRQNLTKSNAYRLGDLNWALQDGLKRLTPAPVTPTPIAPAQKATGSFEGGTRPGDAYNAATNWYDVLTADGAQLDTDRGGYQEWVRPGKDRREGPGATVGYKGSDVLKVFTDAWPNLRQGETYDRFGYYAATRHNGNIAEAARALSALGYGEKGIRTVTAVTPDEWAPGKADPELIKALTENSKAKTPVSTATYTVTEAGFADRMHARHGADWRYVATRQRFGWLHWDGTVWRTDKTGTVTSLINDLVSEQYLRTEEEEDEDKRNKLRTALQKMQRNAAQVGATSMFARMPNVAIESERLDAHQTKMTCVNGVLDLDTLAFSAHDRELLATKKLGVAYDPQATCPKWEKFLAEVLPSKSMREYLQRAIGYTLLGKPNAKAIFMLHGPSHTGKSQVVNALAAVFGDFAEGAKEQTFRVSDTTNGPTPGLHKLQGARLVTASESTEGVKLDESLIKQLTGGDAICSRPLYGDEETWIPQFSIWVATNHLPKFSSDDNAIWRRVKPILFDQVFGTEDRGEVFDIGRKLVAEEGAGILNWVLAGVAAYRKVGLIEPQQLRDGVVAYQQDSDPVARFLEAQITEGVLATGDKETWIESKVLYSWFQSWCEDEGIRYPLAQNRFGRRLATLGYVSDRDATRMKRIWRGLGRGSAPGPAVWLAGSMR